MVEDKRLAEQEKEKNVARIKKEAQEQVK